MKHFFDLILSLVIMISLSPVFLFVIIVVRLKLGSPVFFYQTRPGLNGKLFKIMKFRTMLDVTDKYGKPLPDEQRMTAIGGFLRSLSLDELPGLINVLKGDMSLVGPRPLLVQYLPLYNDEQKRRHNVRPGITGWAQVNGRNAISWEQKFLLDVWYVDNRSFWLDVKILLLTVKKVFIRRGISADGHVTIEPFKGSIVSNKLAIIGASGHGKVVAELAEELDFDVSFFDDGYSEKTNVEHWEIKGTLLDFIAENHLYCGAVVAIGNAKVRESITINLNEFNVRITTLKHATASVSRYANIGDGCIIMPGVVINAFSSIGKGCIINSNAVVEHDCKLGDFVHVCPNSAIAGGTIIGERTWVGIGANVRQMTIIGADTTIGAGSSVVNNIPVGMTVVGVPAKALK